MARSLYAVTGGDIITVVTADPTTGDANHKDLSPITAAVTIWSNDRATQITDLLAANGSGSAFTAGSAITTVTPDAVGRVCFYGPDGQSDPLWARDTSGRYWQVHPVVAARSATVKTLLGQPDLLSIQQQLGVDVPTLQSLIRSTVDAYLPVKGYVPEYMIGASDSLPATAPDGAAVDRISGATSAALVASDVISEAITGGAAGTYTTTGAPAALGASTVVIAAVTTILQGGTAPLPTSFTGMGLTWTAITLPVTATGTAAISMALYLGKGTGTAVKPAATYGAANSQVHIRVSRVANANGTIVQQSSVTVSNTTPSASLPSTPGSATAVICVVAANSATIALTPGTGYTEVGSAVPGGSFAMRTSIEAAVPGTQGASWTTTGNNQKLLAILEVS